MAQQGPQGGQAGDADVDRQAVAADAQERTAFYAARLGRSAPAVSLSNSERQWGLCTAEGAIRYSWRLVHLAPSLVDYVIAHGVYSWVAPDVQARGRIAVS